MVERPGNTTRGGERRQQDQAFDDVPGAIASSLPPNPIPSSNRQPYQHRHQHPHYAAVALTDEQQDGTTNALKTASTNTISTVSRTAHANSTTAGAYHDSLATPTSAPLTEVRPSSNLTNDTSDAFDGNGAVMIFIHKNKNRNDGETAGDEQCECDRSMLRYVPACLRYDSEEDDDNGAGREDDVENSGGLDRGDDDDGTFPNAQQGRKRKRRRRPPIEATGLALDIFARATIIMSSLFMGPALLQLATQQAQGHCNTYSNNSNNNGNDDNDNRTNNTLEEDCRVYGFRPSSLLTNIATISGLLVCTMLPLFGAIVDHTPYRKHVGIATAIGLVLVKSIETCVSRSTWFFVAMLQIVSSLLYNPHVTASYAYTSELSNNPKEQSKYNTQFIVILYCSTLLFLVEVLGYSKLFSIHDDSIKTARVSQVITATTSIVCFGFAWKYLFPNRPALHAVPHGQNLVSSGFRKVFGTIHRIRTQYTSLRWYMLSLVFADAAVGALVAISTTYMTQVLQMNSAEIGLVFLLTLISGIPGSKLGGYISMQLYNPVTSAKICDIYFILVTTIAAFTLTGPERKHATLIFGPLWGLGLGWLPPMHVAGFISITPKGQEAEMMGMFLLCNQILAWLPPFLFTILNEAGVDMAYGMASLNLFFFLGFLFLSIMGDFDQAVQHAQKGHNNHPFHLGEEVHQYNDIAAAYTSCTNETEMGLTHTNPHSATPEKSNVCVLA